MISRSELQRATLILTDARLIAERLRGIDAASITLLGETAARLGIGPEVRSLVASRVAVEIKAYLARQRMLLTELGIEPDFEPDPAPSSISSITASIISTEGFLGGRSG